MSELEAIFAARRRRFRWGTNPAIPQLTAAIRRELPKLIADLRVRTLVDAPCGEGSWMRTIPLDDVFYTGIDIVEHLIEGNRRDWGDGRTFLQLDITRDPIPQADLILCRDCLVHFPPDLVRATLTNFKRSGSTYILTTTFPDHTNVETHAAGPWHPINLEAPPYSLPAPRQLISEQYTVDMDYADKSLGLWRLDEIGPAQGV